MITPSLTRLIGKLFVRPSRQDRRRAARLGVERLEGRDVPAGVFTITAVADATEGGAAGAVRVHFTGDPGGGSAFLTATGGTAGPWYDLADGWQSYFSVSAGGYTDVPLAAFDDSTFEGAETLTVTVVVYSPSGATVGTPGTATITIHDNEPPPVVTVERVADAVEGDADGTFRFTRTGDTGQSLTVSYTVVTTGTGAATPGTDYTALVGTVTFPQYSDTADVTVDAGTDGLIEGEEWVSLTIDEDPDYEIGWADGAVVMIRDQTREVSVAGVQDAKEGEWDGTLRFTRTGDLAETLTVTYTVATTGPSLATPTADYTPLTGTVTFAAYASTVDVSLVPTDDSVPEPDEVVMVTIAAAATYTIGSGTGQVWIEDDDGGRMIWVATSAGDWWTPSNWEANREPVPEDHLYFIGSYSQQNMTWLGSLPLSHAGIHVNDDYTGTVSLTAPVSVGTLTMDATYGTIDQPNGTGSALTITSRFEWTGGTINSSGNASTVTLSGGAGDIKPTNEGTVTTGSTLSLVSGAALNVLPGVIDFIGGNGLYVHFGVAHIRPSGPVHIRLLNPESMNTAGGVNIGGNGSVILEHTGGTQWGDVRIDMPVYNLGTFNIKRDVRCFVNPPGSMGSYAFDQSLGLTVMQYGSMLFVPRGFRMLGGNLRIEPISEGGTADIVGTFIFDAHTEDEISFELPVPAAGVDVLSYSGSLRIRNGDFVWRSGTFVGRADGSDANRSWNLSVQGNITIGAGPNGGSRRVFVEMHNPAATVANRSWQIISSGKGIAGTNPTFLGGGVPYVSPNNFSFLKDATNSEYRLKKL